MIRNSSLSRSFRLDQNRLLCLNQGSDICFIILISAIYFKINFSNKWLSYCCKWQQNTVEHKNSSVMLARYGINNSFEKCFKLTPSVSFKNVIFWLLFLMGIKLWDGCQGTVYKVQDLSKNDLKKSIILKKKKTKKQPELIISYSDMN